VATFGSLRELRCDRVDLERARAWCSATFEQLDGDDLEAKAPVLQVGWSFDAHPRPGVASVWAAWPRLWLHLPKLAVVRLDGSDVFVISNDYDVSRARERARAVRRQLAAAPAAPHPRSEPGGGVVADQGAERERYQAIVRAALNSIVGGAADKLVVARAAACRPHRGAFDALATARRLRDLHPEAFSFAWFDAGRCFAGATPELLARVDNGWVHSHALAGTAPRGSGDELLASRKDRHEHTLVVEGIRNALGPSCHTLRVDAVPKLVNAGPVHHLRSAIAGRLIAGEDLLSVGARLHPTPALGGTPRDVAVAWLRHNEGFERGWYGSPIGWLDQHGGGTLAVAIRSLLVEADRGWAFTGAGIVSSSLPEAEWRETCTKLESVRRSLRSRSPSSRLREVRA
jgi:salicylate biosynthesis isochorismate synthase